METQAEIKRRNFLAGAATIPIMGLSARALAEEPASQYPGMIVREFSPVNLEFPFATLDSFITPTEHFYVRNHFPMPSLEVASWRLKVEGAVEKPLELRYDEIRNMPAQTKTAMLECAGNGRIFLVPKAKGLLWEFGGVGNAGWTGVPLGAVLDQARLKSSAVEVVLEGYDKGEITEDPKSPGEIHYSRSIPLEKARKDVLLAFKMNGEDLAPKHGFPVRAIVPGWYGMASVKWLSRIIVVEKPFAGFFQSIDYSYFEREAGIPTLVPVTKNQVKSQIARPNRGETVPKGTSYRVHGAAWAGESDVTKVEVSQDGGKSWSEAKLTGEAVRHAWRLWEWTWQTPKSAGPVLLMSRATDQLGRVQPMKHDQDRRTSMISHVLPVEVEVS